MDDPLSTFPGYVLRRAASAASVRLADCLSSIGMRQVDASTLILIDRHPGIMSRQLGDILGIKSANMATLMARLDEAQLIEREQIDGRTQGIHLSPAGAAQLAQVRAIMDDFESELLANVPENARPHLLPALTAIWQWAADAGEGKGANVQPEADPQRTA